MGIDVSLAIREAGSRFASGPGLFVAGMFVLLGLVEIVVMETIVSRLIERFVDSLGLAPMYVDQIRQELATEMGFDLGLGLEPAIAIFLVAFLLVIAFRVVGIRVFAAASDGGFPTKAVKYRYFVAFLFVLLFEFIMIAVTFLLFLGPAFLVGAITSPGPGGSGGGLLLILYALVLGVFIALPLFLYFARQEMVLNDRNTLAAISASYGLCRANMGAVFVLLALIFVLNFVGGMILGYALAGLAVSGVITMVYTRLIVVFGIAASTRAYLQTQ